MGMRRAGHIQIGNLFSTSLTICGAFGIGDRQSHPRRPGLPKRCSQSNHRHRSWRASLHWGGMVGQVRLAEDPQRGSGIFGKRGEGILASDDLEVFRGGSVTTQECNREYQNEDEYPEQAKLNHGSAKDAGAFGGPPGPSPLHCQGTQHGAETE